MICKGHSSSPGARAHWQSELIYRHLPHVTAFPPGAPFPSCLYCSQKVMYRLTSKGMTCLYKTSIWTWTLEFCYSPTLPLSCQNLPGFQIHRYLTDNKRSVHKHCCLSPKNTHGSGHAVNLLHFTLLLNLTTAVLLEGNSAWMSVGSAQQSTLWEVHKGIELLSLLHSSCGWPTGLRSADAYSLCASLLLLIFF